MEHCLWPVFVYFPWCFAMPYMLDYLKDNEPYHPSTSLHSAYPLDHRSSSILCTCSQMVRVYVQCHTISCGEMMAIATKCIIYNINRVYRFEQLHVEDLSWHDFACWQDGVCVCVCVCDFPVLWPASLRVHVLHRRIAFSEALRIFSAVIKVLLSEAQSHHFESSNFIG